MHDLVTWQTGAKISRDLRMIYRWADLYDIHNMHFTVYWISSLFPKLYIPSILNTDLIVWQLQWIVALNSHGYLFCSQFMVLRWLKPSLSTKILSINDFITKLLSKLLRDFSNKVHLKSISKFINKVINRYFFVNGHLKTGPFMKILSANNFVNKLANNL